MCNSHNRHNGHNSHVSGECTLVHWGHPWEVAGWVVVHQSVKPPTPPLHPLQSSGVGGSSPPSLMTHLPLDGSTRLCEGDPPLLPLMKDLLVNS